MKRNYLKYTLIVLLGMGVISCKKSFLQTTPKGEFLESNYYQTPDQAFSGLVAAYDPLVTETGGLVGILYDMETFLLTRKACFGGVIHFKPLDLEAAIIN